MLLPFVMPVEKSIGGVRNADTLYLQAHKGCAFNAHPLREGTTV